MREFVEAAFDCAGLDWKRFVVIDPKFVRPAEVDLLIGDPRKARDKLGWSPKVKFRDLIKSMVEEDIRTLKNSISLNSIVNA